MKQFLLIVSIFYFVFSSAQIAVNNPSFEGTPATHVVPSPWVTCYGTPDTQPGQWGITMPPSDGNSYVSFLQSGNCDYPCGYAEGTSQLLAAPLIAGDTYSFTIDLAYSNIYNTAEPVNCYGSFVLFGGNTTCSTTEILWQSGKIMDTTWQTFSVTFIPDSDYSYISFRPYFIDTCSGYINILADNMSSTLTNISSINLKKNTDGIIRVYPQPSSDFFIMEYFINKRSKVKSEIYDMRGRVIKILFDEDKERGEYYFKINTGNLELTAGAYLIKLSVNEKAYFRKLILH